MTSEDINELQRKTCIRRGTDYMPPTAGSKIGISLNARSGILPLNGLRHPPEGDTCGWYVYAGEELSTSPDFFKPLHIEHLTEYCPQIIPYLGLPPGWRFLLAGDYEDVWYDEALLCV